MLQILRDACENLINSHPSFWLLSGAADVSFETGSSARNKEIRAAMKDARCDPVALNDMHLNPSGIIAQWIEDNHPSLREDVRTNKGKQRRPDLEYGNEEAGTKTCVEIMVVLETTTPKFYGFGGNHVAEDYNKLDEYESARFKYLLVFFLALPNYDYPAGGSKDGGIFVPTKSRDCYRFFKSVDEQYSQVFQHLKIEPVKFSGDSLREKKLPPPSEALLAQLNKWSSQVFRPETAWRFEPRHFEGASAGYSIWSR